MAFMISKINYDYLTYYFADDSALFFLLHAYLKSYDCFWLLKSIKWEFVDHRKISTMLLRKEKWCNVEEK